ncbi:hypothetical protein C461_03143 [Halorubrum aidingense JCM 13560]|uniref:Uncharacterized protein n=1 Tax=Halorubrum aidingense JCM 13560 TaxID=1230454 RepID=M0PHC8_9EURY|nr:hypothetical protein [Halorubrum aidingense]EMA69323.1 hypothetical protein C461_03143 [Halorubrum aidingense JCM 13560]
METQPCGDCGEPIPTDVRSCPECGFAPWKPLLGLGVLGAPCSLWIGFFLLFLSGIPLLAYVVWGIGALTLLALPSAVFARPTD